MVYMAIDPGWFSIKPNPEQGVRIIDRARNGPHPRVEPSGRVRSVALSV